MVIGEIARYRLQTTFPEGTTNSLNFQDVLPSGLLFLNDGTAKVAFVANTPANITSSTLSGAGLQVAGDETTVAGIAPTFVLPGGAISPATPAPGDDPMFSLGNVVNAESDANTEYVIVEFNALVVNVTGNQNATHAVGHLRVRTNTPPWPRPATWTSRSANRPPRCRSKSWLRCRRMPATRRSIGWSSAIPVPLRHRHGL